MTDPLDRLKAALDAAPEPDALVKARQIAQAQKKFDAVQGLADAARPTSERPEGRGVLTGVRNMFANLTSRAGLAATTGLVACGFAAFVLIPQMGPLAFGPTETVKPKPAVLEPATVIAPDANTTTPVIAPSEDAVGRVVDAVEPELLDVPIIEPDVIIETTPSGPLATVMESLRHSFRTAPQAPPTAQPGGVTLSESAESVILGDGAGPQFHTDMDLSRAQGGLQFGTTELAPLPEADSEAFANEDPSPLKITAEEPVSTFSIDTDTASYSVIRSSILGMGRLPAPEAVRVEEMINYFPYAYPAPDGDAPFQPTVQVMPTPWNAGTELVHIALQGEMPAVADRPPLNLVFLIDTSGSMQNPNKLPLLIQSFRLMLNELRPEDEVAIVTYAGSAGQVLEATPASERRTILTALERLEAGGSTAGQEGLQQAYAVADSMAEEGEIGRVILATDGDFNVGIHDPAALEDFIAEKRDTGVYLSVLGFGRGNLDDATMQALAQNGNGTASYIDSLSEARKVLVDQLTGALFPIANDVKVQVEFNPGIVAEYRLIGYETRALNREDFNNDAVDAGEIGAGHSVTALYEITRVGSEAVLNDPLRYGAAEEAESDEIGFLRLRYKAPGAAESQLIEAPIGDAVGEASMDAQFAVAVAGFGQLLRGSDYLGSWSYGDAAALAEAARGEDRFGYRAEAVQMMWLAEALAE